MKVLIIHSQVSRGFVGSNTTALVLQLAGVEVINVPTVLYSNHLGHAVFGGGVIPDDLFADVLRGIRDFGGLDEVDFVLTGFFGSQRQVELSAAFLRSLKDKHPHVRYLCDPVMGDIGKGQYVSEEIPAVLTRELVPLADYLTPNLFEAQMLLGEDSTEIHVLQQAFKTKLALERQSVIITGVSVEEGSFGNYYVNQDQHIYTKVIDLHPPGTGELFAAHLLLSLLEKKGLGSGIALSADLVHQVMAHMQSAGGREFSLEDILFSMKQRKQLSVYA
jgi:pyridoxine kinase